MLHAKYQIKCMLREKSNLFWSLLFPIFLGTLFYFMFGELDKMDMFQEIPVGIVDYEEDTEFVDIMESAKMDDGVHMFQVMKYASKEDAEKALEEENIVGYIQVKDDLKLVVKKSETDTSIVKMFLDQYHQNYSLIENVMKEYPERLPQLIESMTKDTADITVKEISLKGEDKDPYSQYFFALLAMTCLIACTIGTTIGTNIQADGSLIGARRNVAPVSKLRQVLTDFCAAFFVYGIQTMIVLAFCIFVLKRDFGSNTLFVLLGVWCGSFLGMAAGLAIGVIPSGSRKKKDGLCVAFFMFSSFLGGLQWQNITYLIEQKCPVINRINPATLIVNSFQSLAVFGDVEAYYRNMMTMFVMGCVLLVLSVIKIRRSKYASL